MDDEALQVGTVFSATLASSVGQKSSDAADVYAVAVSLSGVRNWLIWLKDVCPKVKGPKAIIGSRLNIAATYGIGTQVKLLV